MSDEDSSPSSVASTSSHFPSTYLRLLDGLPLPERYLIKDVTKPPVDDLTISEISIPTQTQTEASRDDDDTDLDASDFDDEVSDFNGTLKGSEGSQESVFWRGKNSPCLDNQYSKLPNRKPSQDSQESLYSQLDTESVVRTKNVLQEPEILSEGFKLQRKVRPKPQRRLCGKDNEETKRKANIGYGVPRSDSLPTAHVFPSPAFPLSSATTVPVTSATSSASATWNIQADTTTTNFEALREDHNITYNTSPPGENFDGGNRWEGTKSYLSGTVSNFRHQPHPPLASTLPAPSQSRSVSSIGGAGSVYDHNLYGSSHHRQQRGTSPSSYLPPGYTGWSRGGDFSSDRLTTPLVDDVTQWQQRHQEQLRRQQMDYADPLRVGGSAGRDAGHYMTGGSTDPNTIFDPHRLDSVRQAADNIIKEKDQIIDRQKLAILQLEQQGKASEAEITRNMLKKTEGEVDFLRLKLQEQEYQNARLKSRLTEVSTGGNETRSTLERKLGEAEFNLQQLSLSKEQVIQDKDTLILKLQTKLGELEKNVSMWRERYTEAQKTCSDLQDQKASLERYMQDLPTQDERNATKTKVSTLQADLERECGRVHELEKQVADTRRNISARDALIHQLETCNSEKEELILKIQNEQAAMSVELQRLKGEGPPSEDDIEELKYKNTRLQADLDKARKLLESHERQKRESLRRREAETQEVSKRLEQEIANVQALKAEVSSKDNDLKRVIASNRKLSRQRQECLEKTVALEEKVASLSAADDATAKDDIRKLERRLMVELSVCFSELQSLVNVCVQRADGHDPNISALLGARASTSTDLGGDPGIEDTLQSLKYRVSKVRELRDDLDRLREVISNKYAEDMGENLNCATQ